MRIPCDQRINCNCDELSTNYSSEAPDRQFFIGRFYGPQGDPDHPPQIGPDSCFQTCGPIYSASFFLGGGFFPVPVGPQQAADDCAERHAIICANGAQGGLTVVNSCDVCRPANTGGFLPVTPAIDPNAEGPCCDPETITSLPEEVPAECCCRNIDGDPDVPPADPDNPPQPTLFGNQPQSCTSFCPDGTGFTATVRGGYFVAASLELANQMAHSLACQNARRLRICISDFNRKCCKGEAFDGTMTAEASLPITWTADGLPPGLTLNGETGQITGTPTVAGNFNFTAEATSSAGAKATKQMSISVVGFNETSLGDAVETLPFSAAVSATGGDAPYTYVKAGGPAWINVSASGVVSGTPPLGTGGSTVSVDIIVSDATSLPGQGCLETFDLNVAVAITVTMQVHAGGGVSGHFLMTMSGEADQLVATGGGFGIATFNNCVFGLGLNYVASATCVDAAFGAWFQSQLLVLLGLGGHQLTANGITANPVIINHIPNLAVGDTYTFGFTII